MRWQSRIAGELDEFFLFVENHGYSIFVSLISILILIGIFAIWPTESLRLFLWLGFSVFFWYEDNEAILGIVGAICMLLIGGYGLLTEHRSDNTQP
jgi:hypothetical protein